MDSIIKIDNTTIIRGINNPIVFEVVDENNNPVNGKAVVKLNKKTTLSGRVENGRFEGQLEDLNKNFKNDEYKLDIIFAGSNEINPTSLTTTLKIINTDSVELTMFDLQNSSYRLTKWIDINQRILGKILINGNEISIGYLLYILATAVKQINEYDDSNIDVIEVKTPRISSENIKENVTLNSNDFINIADEIIKYSEDNLETPNCVIYNGKKIGFINLLYSFAKIVANSSTNCGLISSYTVRPWNEIIKK